MLVLSNKRSSEENGEHMYRKRLKRSAEFGNIDTAPRPTNYVATSMLVVAASGEADKSAVIVELLRKGYTTSLSERMLGELFRLVDRNRHFGVVDAVVTNDWHLNVGYMQFEPSQAIIDRFELVIRRRREACRVLLDSLQERGVVSLVADYVVDKSAGDWINRNADDPMANEGRPDA